MSVYLNVNSANGNPVNFLGITDSETAITAGLAAVVAALIGLGVFAGAPAILLGIFSVLALYGFFYSVQNLNNVLGNAYNALAQTLQNVGITNPATVDIIISIIALVVICLLAYAGYYIYENV